MNARIIRGGLIGLGALILSTIGIFAADTLQGVDGGIGNFARVGDAALCPHGMGVSRDGKGALCVDLYEVSPSDTCPNAHPLSVLHTEQNIADEDCFGASVEGGTPWTYITLAHAQRLCARAGKRLPTSAEWYALALGTEEKECVINDTESRNAHVSSCMSAVGAYDMIGNVWEWVNETVVGRTWQNRELPEEGYVAEADVSGIAITTQDAAQAAYTEDYFWSKEEGVFGMIRGGFYGSGSDAGLYTVNASVPTNFATQGVGFRCVQSL